MLTALGDLVAPRHCLVCGRDLKMNERHICIFCDADMPFTRYAGQEHNPMADAFNAVIERHMAPEDAHMPYSRAASLFFYNSETGYKYIPQALKYHGDFRAGRHFAALLGRELSESELFNDVDVVIPVPLHWTRRLRRGYNQAGVIGRAVAEELGCPCREDILRRTRRTRTQTALGVKEKAANVSAAFALRDCQDEFRHILVVDDVFTTGATLGECQAVLRRGFPSARISVATLSSVV